MDTRTRGHGAAWATRAVPGDQVTLELPYGHFLHDAATGDTHPDDTPRRRRIFVATGTGIAPFLAEFEQSLRADDVLLLGLATTSEDPTTRLDTPLPRVIRCVSREDAPGCFHGRVTHYLRAHGIDPHADYYVCGSPLMVADVARLIRAHGEAGTARAAPASSLRQARDHNTSSSTQSRVRVTAFFHRR